MNQVNQANALIGAGRQNQAGALGSIGNIGMSMIGMGGGGAGRTASQIGDSLGLPNPYSFG
jgi:hypothetical protein